MDLNAILFPAPKSSYSTTQLNGELIWIPKEPQSASSTAESNNLSGNSRYSPVFTYDTPLLKTKPAITIGDAISKPQCKNVGLDDLSVITTASSKKTSRVMEGDGLTDLIQRINIQDVNERSNQEQAVLQPPPSSFRESNMASFIEEPVTNILPQGYTRRKTLSHLDKVHQPNFYSYIPEPIKFLKGKLPKVSANTEEDELDNCADFDLEPVQSKPKTTNIKPSHPHSALVSNRQHAKPKLNSTSINQSVIKRDQSQSSFDLHGIDEYAGKKLVMTSPRSLHRYGTRNFSNPIVNSPPQRRTVINLVTDSIAQNFSTMDNELSNAPTSRAHPAITEEFVNPFQNRQASKPFCQSMVSPVSKPIGRHLRRTDPVSKSLNTFPLKELRPPVGPVKVEALRQTFAESATSSYIPCLLLRSGICTRKFMVYFHGNGEDVNLAYDLLCHIRNNLNINVLAVEYPGYGLYKGVTNEEKILVDAEIVYEFLVTRLKLDPRDILIFGRSIGSGPATYLASRKNIGALILMSAFTSIRSAVKDIAGKWAQYLIKERFDNLKAISAVTCPTFLIHGQKDSLIPFQHSEALHGACRGASELLLPKKMDHIEFDFYEDFTSPLVNFLQRCGIKTSNGNGRIFFPKNIFVVPEEIDSSAKLKTHVNTKQQQQQRRRVARNVTIDLTSPTIGK